MRLRENSRSAKAAATFLPRISWASRLSFCGLTRSIRATAFASFSGSVRSRAVLPMAYPLSPLGFAIGGMAVESPRRRELAELVPDHFLGNQHWNVLLAVMDAERQPDELRQDGRTPAPHFDDFMPARRARGLCLLQQIAVDERTLPDGTRHDARPTFSSSARGGLQ